MTENTTQPGGLLAALSDQLADAVERAGAAVVRVEARRRQAASGLVWTADGLILTADHVLEREDDLVVGLPGGDKVAATIVGRDAATDIALLRLAGAGPAPIERGPTPRVGSLVMVVARPGQMIATSGGVISAITGPARTWRGGQLESLLRTDATLYPGFSGGALVDSAGRTLGLATSQFGPGAGFALPLSTLERVTTALLSHGRVKRGFLGVSSQPVALPDMLRGRLGVEQSSALLIVGIEAGGPAERGGLMIGDLLVALDGEAVRGTDDLRALLGPEHVGKSVAVRVARGGEPLVVNVTIGERE